MERDILEKRKEKIIEAIKKPQFWVITLLGIALILGVYIRSMPMQDHGGRPGLWDQTRNDWTLGPDLDPWLFTRQAKTIAEEGSLPEFDMMRNVPLGFENAKETVLLPYMIYWTWKAVNLFGTYSIEFAAALFPVIMFGLTIITFFLFVREAFNSPNRKQKTKANIIALIATYLMIVIPVFLSRTIAGIPEKESAIFFFLFLAFFCYLRAWKTNPTKQKLAYALGAGISIALGALISGLYIYGFIAIALSTFVAFIINNITKENKIAFAVWLLSIVILLPTVSERFTALAILTSTTTGIATLTLLIFIIDAILWNTKLANNKYLQTTKLPRNIVSTITAILVGAILASLVFGPDFILEKLRALHQQLFRPTTGRWNITVAENRQPYFLEWVGSFGPYIGKIPILFWMFIIGSAMLFKNALKKLHQKDALKLTGFYLLFLFGLIFSRYASNSIFNGENFISKSFYYITAIIFIASIIKTYIEYQKKGHKGFKEIPYEALLLIGLFLLTVFSARSAIRLVMVLGPVGAIFAAYLITEVIFKFLQSEKDSNKRMIYGILALILILSGAYTFITFNQASQAQAYNMVPSIYNYQWQNAMSWVRDNTPTEAVFAHWWDYGYWVQSIGERPTVTDGGNAINFWNYLSGRYVLTGEDQQEALNFLHAHNADYLLIDSSDIGKYGAFSSIGSNYEGDRQSFIPTIASNPSQTREISNGVQRIYPAQFGLDEDITYELNGTNIYLPAGRAGLGYILLTFIQEGNTTALQQPQAVFFDTKGEYRIPLRYAEQGGQFIDFGTGLEGAIKIIQSYNNNGQGVSIDQLGGALYVSPRVMRGYLAQKYLFDDPFGNFEQFNVAHKEPSIIVSSLRSSGAPAEDFVLYQGGLQGPITIWEIEYTGNEEFDEMYTDRIASKYISWEL